ncbi:MAG: hypothetical protein RR319_09670, partial [Bacteroides sp.]
MNRQVFLILFIALFTGGTFVPFCAYAQEIMSKSESQRPEWLANKTPKPTNTTFYYQITESEHQNLEDAKHSCLINLSTYIKQTNHITTDTKSEIKVDNTNEGQRESEKYLFTYTVKGEELSITFNKKDEYWEYILYPNGERIYRCYTLFAVANLPGKVVFDQLTFSRKYGGRGFVRSLIVPGWGQMYKGSTVKGISILGGEALLVGGIIVAENMRASYQNKWKQQKNKN